jgi:pimeloyl-ACP methyl ester carboxylesterase
MECALNSQFSPFFEAVRLVSGDQLNLAGTLAGGSGAPVLLAHGFGQTRQSWSGAQERLADSDYASLAFDMRGHGQSDRNAPDNAYAADQFISDMVTCAERLGRHPVLVGASMGGLIGLLTQSRHQLFSALVLVDVTPRWEAAGTQRIHAFMTANPNGFDSFEHASEVIANYLPHRRQRKTPAQLAHLLHRDQQDRLRWHWDPRLLSEFIAGSENFRDVLAQAASTIDVPVLLISGGRSDLVSDDTVRHFLDLVPHAQHVCLPEATHMVAGDDNDAFTDSLLSFLRAQSSSSPSFSRTPPGVLR